MSNRPCMSEVRGMADVVAAVERAVIERKGILLVGPPGIGKTLIARRVATIMPEPSIGEQAWIRAEFEGCGLTLPAGPVDRPFRAPHHTVSTAALVGLDRVSSRFWTGLKTYRTDTISRAGEFQLARHGVLMLDEVEEFRIEALRALADRMTRSAVRPLIVATAMLCPCGWYGLTERQCSCTDAARDRYAARVTAAAQLLGLTIRIAIPPTSLATVRDGAPADTSDAIRARVAAAWSPPIPATAVGAPVLVNGQTGTISEVMTGQLAGMVLVRLERGEVCVDFSECTPAEADGLYTLRIGTRLTRKVDSLQTASLIYQRMRDDSGEGGSTFPFGTVGPYTISYNGRVWLGERLVMEATRTNGDRCALRAEREFAREFARRIGGGK